MFNKFNIMAKTFIGVREVDEEIFRKFRAIAVEDKIRLGEALTKVMERRIADVKMREREKTNMAKELLKVKPLRVGKKVRWSEEVDEFLYGLNR